MIPPCFDFLTHTVMRGNRAESRAECGNDLEKPEAFEPQDSVLLLVLMVVQ